MSKREANQGRPMLKWLDVSSTDSIRKSLEARDAKPINRATQKLEAFINACVQDEDFKHAQSAHLLDFLMGVRDVLCDGLNELWTLDDIVLPISIAAKRRASQNRTHGFAINSRKRAEAKQWAQSRALEIWADDEGQILRTSEVARKVWEQLLATKHAHFRPAESGVAHWVRKVAPNWAKRGGRPTVKP